MCVKKQKTKSRFYSLALLIITSIPAFAQTADEQFERIGLNTITTAVPFLLITPDSRGGAMGDAGVATSPDAMSAFWNTSKAAFVKDELGIAVSYVPWLKAVVPDIYLGYLSGYKRISDRGTVTGSLRYFSLGEINFTDEVGNPIQNVNPNELAVDLGYAHKLSDKLAGGFSLRYIHSNLTQGVSVGGVDAKPATAVAADLNVYYESELEIGKKDAVFSFGLNFQNIGNRVSYSESADRDFIPINMKLGSGLLFKIDQYNEFGIYLDINKLLVPTPPLYAKDSLLNLEIDANGDPVIEAGKNPDVGVPVGMLQSFYDAPGGASEEFQEYNWSIGLEYWYDRQFAVRAGYFYENPNKGNRQYFTMGVGIKYQIFNLDFSYLVVPSQQRSPLENTLRFTLAFDIGKKDNKKDSEE